jgi:hypothetical protein
LANRLGTKIFQANSYAKSLFSIFIAKLAETNNEIKDLKARLDDSPAQKKAKSSTRIRKVWTCPYDLFGLRLALS